MGNKTEASESSRKLLIEKINIKHLEKKVRGKNKRLGSEKNIHTMYSTKKKG